MNDTRTFVAVTIGTGLILVGVFGVVLQLSLISAQIDDIVPFRADARLDELEARIDDLAAAASAPAPGAADTGTDPPAAGADARLDELEARIDDLAAAASAPAPGAAGTGTDPPAAGVGARLDELEARIDDLAAAVSAPAPDAAGVAAVPPLDINDHQWEPRYPFRDCEVCPEMVVMPAGDMALGRYEVTVGEYRAFASATGRGAGGGCLATGDSWRNPGFGQGDRHPVVCVSWDDAQEYVSWLSGKTTKTYRLPTEDEWESAAAGSQTTCSGRSPNDGTCAVDNPSSFNAAGLSGMVGNVWEWTSGCWEGNCGRPVHRGGSGFYAAEPLGFELRSWNAAGDRRADVGFRVVRLPSQR